MRSFIAGLMIVLVALGGRGASHGPSPREEPEALLVRESPSPFAVVSAGPVSTVVPNSWEPALAHPHGIAQRGVVASPHLERWTRMDGLVEGITAVWIDVASVGVPSDYYYLAAAGPALRRLTGARHCRAVERSVILDHRPSFFDGRPNSPGDYMARGRGACRDGRRLTKWAYFVAAPGYGPVRRVGIPNSGLYVVVAVVPHSPRASERLNALLRGARFGGAGLTDFVAAARS